MIEINRSSREVERFFESVDSALHRLERVADGATADRTALNGVVPFDVEPWKQLILNATDELKAIDAEMFGALTTLLGLDKSPT